MSLTQSTNKGLLLVVSGPSGVGKGTVLAEVFAKSDNLFYSVSATTREPRPGETDGVNYHFLQREDFLSKVSCGKMLEHAQYGTNFYGTPAESVERMREDGKDVVLEIEVKGAMQVKKALPEAVLIMVLPPHISVLEERLRGRATEAEVDIVRRLSAAREEIKSADKYDYIVINDEVSDAAERLLTIIKAEKMRALKADKITEEVLK